MGRFGDKIEEKKITYLIFKRIVNYHIPLLRIIKEHFIMQNDFELQKTLWKIAMDDYFSNNN